MRRLITPITYEMVQKAMLAKGQVRDHGGVGASMKAALEAIQEMYDPEKEATLKSDYDQLEYDLTLHPPVADITKMKMERVRADAKAFGISILSNTPASREQSLAKTKLEETLSWAIAALARHQ